MYISISLTFRDYSGKFVEGFFFKLRSQSHNEKLHRRRATFVIIDKELRKRCCALMRMRQFPSFEFPQSSCLYRIDCTRVHDKISPSHNRYYLSESCIEEDNLYRVIYTKVNSFSNSPLSYFVCSTLQFPPVNNSAVIDEE